jgi:membrane protein
VGVLAALLKRFNETNLVSQSAALAFYALLSLAPLLLILLWITAAALPSARDAFLDQVGSLLGHDFGTVADAVLTSARAKPNVGSIAGLWSVGLLLFGATAVFGQLQTVLNQIFRTSATHLPGIVAWLRKRVFSFGMVLALGFLLLVSMTVNTLLEFAFARVAWLLPAVASIFTWLIYALSFALMFHYLPDRRVGWRCALVGGVFTASLFVLGRAVIAWYLERSNPGAAYGAMGALVLTLIWVYYAGLIVFVGAVVTAVIDERGSRRSKARVG